MINLKIDPEFQNQIPPLTDDEFKQLEENILKEGKLLSPLIVWTQRAAIPVQGGSTVRSALTCEQPVRTRLRQ